MSRKGKSLMQPSQDSPPTYKASFEKKKKEEVEAMSNGVLSDDPSLQLESITKLRKILSLDSPPMQHIILSPLLPCTVMFLKEKDFPELQYEAAWVLINMAFEKPEVVVYHGAVPIFVQLLASSKNDDVIEQVIWALGNVAGDRGCRDYVLECGALKPLLTHFTEYSKLSKIRIATWTLKNFCRGEPYPPLDQLKPALPTLGQLIQSNDEEVLKLASLALWHLSNVLEDGIESIIKFGVVPKVLKLLKHPSPLVLELALCTVGNIVAGNSQQTQCVISHGALPYLANLLTGNYENRTKKNALWTVSNITAGTQEQIQSVIDANLIPILVNLGRNAEFEIKKEAIWAITNATSGGSHDQINYLVEQSCNKPLWDLLLCSDLNTISKCQNGLENILKAGEDDKGIGALNHYCHLIYNEEAQERITNLERLGNSEISRRFLTILDNAGLKRG